MAAKLKAASRRSGRSFRDVVNETLRRGLTPVRPATRGRFQIEPRSLGGVRPGLQLDSVGDVLEQVEGPRHR